MNASEALPPSTIDAAEVAKFSHIAATWWDEDGPMAPLHRLNPARMAYVRDEVCAAFARDRAMLRPLRDLKVLDVGCGGGLVAEPLARMGGIVTGLDASAEAIAAARQHATDAGLTIDYRCGTVEALADEGARFDVITALEVVEHVADVDLFLASLARLLATDGLLIFSTPNRTMASYLSVIVGAEWVLRWVPRGTHDWQAFMTPEELSARLEAAGLAVLNIEGLSFSLVDRAFHVSPDTSVNYIGVAVRRES